MVTSGAGYHIGLRSPGVNVTAVFRIITFSMNHPSLSQTSFVLFRVAGCWSLSKLSKQATPWTGGQAIKGPAQRQPSEFELTPEVIFVTCSCRSFLRNKWKHTERWDVTGIICTMYANQK